MDAAGNLVRSEALAHEAADLIDDPRLHAELVVLLGRLRMAGGEVEAGHSMLLEEAERIGELDPALAAALLSFAANLPVFRLEGFAAVELTERAWTLGDPARPRIRRSATPMRSRKRWPATSPAPPCSSSLRWRPRRTWRPGTRWAPRSGGRSSGWRSTPSPAPCSPGRWACRSGGSLLHLPQSLIELAELDFRVGRWVPALAGAYEAIALFEETAQHTELGFAQATIARMEAALGRDEECRRRAQAGFAADAASGLLLASVLAGAALGLLELGRGDPDAAIVTLEAGRANRRGGQAR